jgi:tripartite-type tricarboxylate transporter receptor subunit TctC
MSTASNSVVKCFPLMLAVLMGVCVFTPLQAAEPTAIRMIVPNAPGSSTDSYARIVADPLAKVLGRPVVIENIPGAGQVKAMQELMRAPRDGSTIMVQSSQMAIFPNVFKDLPYDPMKDVTPISVIGRDVVVLVVNPKLPVKNVKELIAMAKSQPGKLNYGTAGPGTMLHFSMELFCSEAGVKLNHVPYKGGSQLMADLLGGHVQLAFMVLPQCREQVLAGNLHALGISGSKRHPALPDVPLITTQGVPNYDNEGWVGLWGPSNLPPAVTKKINAALLEVLKLKGVRDAITTQGTEIWGSTPEEAARFLKADLDKYAKVVKEAGLKFD